MRFLTGGDLIKDIRAKLAVTQSELGMKKINHNTISMIENSTCELTYKLAIRLSENINDIAHAKGLDIRMSATALLEPVEVKCGNWCKEELNEADLIKDYNYKIIKYKEIISVAENYKAEASILEGVKRLGENYYLSASYKEAMECFQQCISIYKKNNDIYNLADNYNYIGMCLYYSDLEESYKYHIKALQTLNNIPDDKKYPLLRTKIIYYIALYYIRIESLDTAEEYINSIKDENLTKDEIYVKLSILDATIKAKNQRYDEAIVILEGLLKLEDELISSNKYIIYNNLGICIEKQGNMDRGMNFLEKAIKLQLDNSTADLTNSLVHSAKMQLKLNKYDIALRYVDGALTNALKHHQFNYTVECYKLTYIIYKNKNIYDRCMDIIYILKQFLGNSNFIDKSNTCKLLELDYLLQTNDFNNAKTLLNNILLKEEEV